MFCAAEGATFLKRYFSERVQIHLMENDIFVMDQGLRSCARSGSVLPQGGGVFSVSMWNAVGHPLPVAVEGHVWEPRRRVALI